MADGRGDVWDPDQYQRFAAERAQPFFDLLALVRPAPGGTVVDLGCGTGELTARLHRHTGARATIGIDSSPAMLERAREHAGDGLRFEAGDIAEVTGEERFDVVLANASLQWLPDHERLLTRLTATLRPAGQLAVQVPANADHPSHRVAAAVAGEAEFREAMGGAPPPDPVADVLAPERYAELLAALGYVEQHVRLQVYGHRLPSTEAVVEWVRGTTLGRFRRVLPEERFEAFVARYRQRLLAELGHEAPYFYAFKRILIWGRAPGDVGGLDRPD